MRSRWNQMGKRAKGKRAKDKRAKDKRAKIKWKKQLKIFRDSDLKFCKLLRWQTIRIGLEKNSKTYSLFFEKTRIFYCYKEIGKLIALIH